MQDFKCDLIFDFLKIKTPDIIKIAKLIDKNEYWFISIDKYADDNYDKLVLGLCDLQTKYDYYFDFIIANDSQIDYDEMPKYEIIYEKEVM